jgi:hypothetical protein
VARVLLSHAASVAMEPASRAVARLNRRFHGDLVVTRFMPRPAITHNCLIAQVVRKVVFWVGEAGADYAAALRLSGLIAIHTSPFGLQRMTSW